ncbi:FG-GAP-like repeat-containing protein [Vibrio sp. WXL103]|uniref:FG-GAP-like repeat-containing protein n=1 Tax=Vibrio sp. WXL103 TaxID=3450710 RepID=UPI003EC70741
MRVEDTISTRNAAMSLLALVVATTLGCSGGTNSHESSIAMPRELPTVTLPASVAVGGDVNIEVEITSPKEAQAIDLVVDIDSAFASISIMQGENILVDHVDIPSRGEHSLRFVSYLADTKAATEETLPLTLSVRTGTVKVKSMTTTPLGDLILPTFTDISEDIGLVTEQTYKYGGPSVGDVAGTGFYDAVLTNHNYIAPQLVTNSEGKSVTIKPYFDHPRDYHGTAFGDYTNNGQLDLMLAMGGANGTNPTSYILFENRDGEFVQPENNAGINTPARGRGARWIDLNNNGWLDLVLVNATTPNYDGPIQLFYQNNGDGTFNQVRVPGIEYAPGERSLIVDFDNDGLPDVVLFSPLTLWKNEGNFTFTDVTSEWLPEDMQGLNAIQAAADMDLTNNGLPDLYLSRGLSEYLMSSKSYDFNPVTKKLDMRDDGNPGRTLIELTTDKGDSITLKDLHLTYRQYNDGYPIFLGNNKEKIWMWAEGFQKSQLHPQMKNGPHSLDIAPKDAQGWPEQREENGIYIGHVGNGEWKMEWVRNGKVYWMVGFTLDNITAVNMDWEPNNRNVDDVLLINQGDKFVDASREWNIPQGGNHWGVTYGDFTNNGWNDLFIYRYGFVKERVTDLLLVNTGNSTFEITTNHGAHDIADPGHGDMGQAFDFDRNGQVDLLNGSNETGHWYLYKNITESQGNYLNVDVGYSPFANIDPLGAKVVIETESGTTPSHQVGSRGEAFSQGVMNLTHFGLAAGEQVKKATVTWRNGETVTFVKPKTNSTLTTDQGLAPKPSAIAFQRTEKKLRPGEIFQLETEFTPLNAKDSVEFSSSSPSVASVDQQGQIQALTHGNAVITLTSTLDPAVTQQFEVFVGDFEPIYVTDIAINYDNEPVYVGNIVDFTAILTSSDPSERPDDQTITWSTSDASIAAISPEGQLTLFKEGQVEITATANGSHQPNNVIDSLSLDVEEFQPININMADMAKLKQQANPIDQPLEITFSYNAGSNATIPKGVQVFLRRLQKPGWSLVNDYAGRGKGQFDMIKEAVGTQTGTLTYALDLPAFAEQGLVPTSDLPDNEFYFLMLKVQNDRGEGTELGVQPICIAAKGQTNDGC